MFVLLCELVDAAQVADGDVGQLLCHVTGWSRAGYDVAAIFPRPISKRSMFGNILEHSANRAKFQTRTPNRADFSYSGSQRAQ